MREVDFHDFKVLRCCEDKTKIDIPNNKKPFACVIQRKFYYLCEQFYKPDPLRVCFDFILEEPL